MVTLVISMPTDDENGVIESATGDVGFLTMAFGGDRYLRQAETLARSLKRHMPQHKLALVTDRPDPGPLFDIVVPMAPVTRAGTVHKTEMYAYSPFEQTLFIDSDCVVARPFAAELSAISQHDFSPVVAQYLAHGDSDLWLEDVGQAIDKVGGTPFPKFNGGVYFFRKGSLAQEVFARATRMRDRAAELGIKDFDRSGPGEETLIGMALSEMRVERLHYDHGRLMRTPLNSTGSISLDVLGGSCHFIKEGTLVAPAICHFCGEFADHPAYLTADYMLRYGHKPPLLWRIAVQSGPVRRKIRNRLRRLRRRLLHV
ncbi:hypothetical protein EAH87_14880 [Sphingomonas koreensis]|nr:hypothetical protein EAH87_14880 [Sphingomonas koreensis]